MQREKWIRLFDKRLEKLSNYLYRPKGDDIVAIIVPGAYERVASEDRIYYAPEMAACARYDQAHKLTLNASDPDFLVVSYDRKPGFDAAQYEHHIPWEKIADLIVGNPG